MRKLIALVILISFSCNEKVEQKEDSQKPEITEKQTNNKSDSIEVIDLDSLKKERVKSKNDLIGLYVGMFKAKEIDINKSPSYSNRITISIDNIENDSIYGKSIVAGNIRTFKGHFSKDEAIILKEPGDNKYDGVFNVIQFNKDEMIGNWVANDKKLAVTERTFKLGKKFFKYDKNLNIDEDNGFQILITNQYEAYEVEEYVDFDFSSLNASTIELKSTDIDNMSKGELEVLRNLIYARHGYSFKNRKMRYFFDNGIDWYIPISTDIRGQLTDLEKKNIDLIKRFEQHAERYYDSFGR